MDTELDEVEIIFAQKLASGEPRIRKRALRKLREWIATCSARNEFSESSLRRLCLGLHYALWMQDKMLLHEKLADDIVSFVNDFNNDKQSASFIKQMIFTLSDEWTKIDRWRMDKFLMLIRRIARGVFKRLKKFGWDNSFVEIYLKVFMDSLISADGRCFESLKYHFASVYLDELDGAGGLSRDQVNVFLKPYIDLLADGATTNTLFRSVLSEIFETILHQYSKDLAEKRKKERKGNKISTDDMGEKNDCECPDEGIKFNYDEIAQMLIDAAKNPEVKSSRRREMYRMAKRFKIAHLDGKVFKTIPIVRPSAGIQKREIKAAVNRFLIEKKNLGKKSVKSKNDKRKSNNLPKSIIKKRKLKK